MKRSLSKFEAALQSGNITFVNKKNKSGSSDDVSEKFLENVNFKHHFCRCVDNLIKTTRILLSLKQNNTKLNLIPLKYFSTKAIMWCYRVLIT